LIDELFDNAAHKIPTYPFIYFFAAISSFSSYLCAFSFPPAVSSAPRYLPLEPRHAHAPRPISRRLYLFIFIASLMILLVIERILLLYAIMFDVSIACFPLSTYTIVA